ncbi:hypothetical protein [Caldivirga sp.]|uniref:hypothetical protein n=1 Tax=Caldivirga sp. TaxID=2080243 RepID=UPI003D14DA67
MWPIQPSLIAGVIGAEALWLYFKWLHGSPSERAHAYSELLNYMLAWIIASAIYAVYQDYGGFVNWIASIIGIKPYGSLINLGTQLRAWFMEAMTVYAAYWTIITVIKFLGSVNFIVFQVNPAAVASWLQNITWSYSTGLQWLMVDIIFQYALWVIWNALNYVWPILVALIVPRTTRPIGASFTALWITLTVSLPILAGALGYVVNRYMWQALTVPTGLRACVNNGWLNATCILGIITTVVMPINLLPALLNPIAQAFELPRFGFQLMTWDALLDVGYALALTSSAWLARLIDENAHTLFPTP